MLPSCYKIVTNPQRPSKKSHRLKLRGFAEDGPYFNGLSVLKARVAFCYHYRFFKAVCVNEPVGFIPALRKLK